MKRSLALLLLVFFSAFVFGQKKYFENKFSHYSIIEKKDTINFHTYSNSKKIPNKILVYVQGSGSSPIFQLIQHTDTIKNNEGNSKIRKYLEIQKTIPFNLETFPSDYLLVVISKKAIPFQFLGENFEAPKAFYLSDNLDYRVWQTEMVIDYILKNIARKPEKLILMGHSEGTEVVAKLGVTNKSISHIGYFSGGGNAQYYDFILDIRKYVQRGEMTEEESVNEIEKLFDEVKQIYKDPNNLNKKFMGHSYKKWSSSVEPSIDNLLQINIPIYVAHGAKDEAVPIESAYLIPIEFIRKKKKNLTFKVYPNLNHSFGIIPSSPKEEYVDKWDLVLDNFLKWCEKK